MKYIISVFYCLVISTFLVSGQKSSASKSENAKTSISRDSLTTFSAALLKEISTRSFKLLDLLNFYKEINLSQEHPLTVKLLNIPDGPLKISDNYDQIKIEGNINLKWLITFGIVGDVTTSLGVLSDTKQKTGGNYMAMLSDGDPFEIIQKYKDEKDPESDFSKAQAYVDSGDFIIEGVYYLNGIEMFFESGSVIISSKETTGQFTNGTILIFKGNRYRYFNNDWQKLL
jgi:hypothetical protein